MEWVDVTVKRPSLADFKRRWYQAKETDGQSWSGDIVKNLWPRDPWHPVTDDEKLIALQAACEAFENCTPPGSIECEALRDIKIQLLACIFG